MISRLFIACLLQAFMSFMAIKHTWGMDLRASRVESYKGTVTTMSSSWSINASWSGSSQTFTNDPIVPNYNPGTVQVNSPSLVLKKDHIITNVPQVRRYNWVVA